MTSLFVAEEADEPAVKLEPGYEVSEPMEVDSEIKVKLETEKSEVQPVDEGVNYQEDSDSDSEDEDDPIIDTIPIHLNSNFGKLQNEGDVPLAPLLLQFPNKSNQSTLTQAHISALHRMQIKPESGVVELRLPLHTDSFFSDSVSSKFNVSEQFLRGVIIHDEPRGNIFQGKIPSVSVITRKDEDDLDAKKEKNKRNDDISSNNSEGNNIKAQPGAVGGSRYLIGLQDKEGHMHLTPISDTCMLRPHFTYIDHAKMSKLEKEKELERELNEGDKNVGANEGTNAEDKKNVSVITMSAKNARENQPRLGGALMSAKLEMDEESQLYQIMKCNEEFIKEQFKDTSGKILHSKLSQEEYLDLLLSQTQL